MIKSYFVIFTIFSALFFFSCGESENSELSGFSSMEVPKEFNYETHKKISLKNLSFEGIDIPEGVKATLMSDLPENDGKKLASFTAGKNSISIEASIPIHMDKVFLYFGFVGLPQGLWIDPADGKIIDIKSSEESALSLKNFQYGYLGEYDSNGVPDYLEEERDVVSDEFLDDVNASLPELEPLTQSHPGYIEDGENINIELIEEADVWITFLHEGAGYKNVLGYYTYTKGNPPQTKEDISEHIVIFPNVSFNYSGGGLISGDKVHLGTFPADTVIGFFLAANGFSGSTLNPNPSLVYYSDSQLNPEEDESLRQHNVLIWDEQRELVLMGFEDLNREYSGCDNDFNDAVFYITSNPVEAMDVSTLKPIDKPVDTDNDGISDVFDEFPEDPQRAFNNYYPGEKISGSLAFEDNWPKMGDYDFNDAFFHFNYNYITDASGKIVEIRALFRVTAVGAAYYNGPALLFDIAPDQIESVTGQQLFDTVFDISENGTEKGIGHTVIPFTDNLHKLMNNSQGAFINTDPEMSYVDPVDIDISIKFKNSQNISTIGLPPYNPFLVVNKVRGKEIHLPGQTFSEKADQAFFQTDDDSTDPENSIFYKTDQNFPWALCVPYEISQMIERADFTNGYLNFRTWAESGGINKVDWYLSEKEGYTDSNHLYKK